MPNPKQDDAVAWVNNVKQAGATALAQKQLIDSLVVASTKEGWLSLAQSFQTSPLNADGSISNTPDATPNPAHPITSPFLGMSWNSINGMMIFCTQFQNLMNNAAVGTIDGTQYCEDINSGK